MDARTKFTLLATKEPIVMALSLDKRRLQEHIIIGSKSQVHLRIADVPTAQVFMDQKRPLGTFLFECEEQTQSDWKLNVHSLLSQALTSWIGRRDAEQAAWEYLEPWINSSNAACKFAAHCAVNVYCDQITLHGSEAHKSLYQNTAANISRFFKHLLLGSEKNSTVAQSLARVQGEMRLNGFFEDSSASMLYPNKALACEWIIVTYSLFPAALYYLQRLRDWGLCFCKCAVCGKIFLAPSLHHNLCSDSCQHARRLQNKREFDERARDNGYDLEYKNTSQRFRNRISSLKKEPCISEEALQKAQAAFTQFRNSALQKKKQIKTQEDCREYRRWLLQQESEFNLLCTTLSSDPK